jgi:peptide subunit release factor 1 (eRF1)
MFTRIEIRDIIERAIATAFQSGIAVLVVTDLSTVKSALAAAAAGAISVVQRAAQRRLARPEVA